MEDFITSNSEVIVVSTIHKAKGKEFDNVFLLLENFDIREDSKKRELYVAMTRAKINLTIHLDGSYLDHIQTEGLERVEDDRIYPPPGETVLQLGHRDLKLGYFGFVQHRIDDMTSGDKLYLADDGCKNDRGEYILKFSQKFMLQLGQLKQDGYTLTEATVNFIVYWTDEKEKEVKIVLPELGFNREQKNVY